MSNIPKSAFTFLNQLKKNNNREWFTEHKPAYQKAHSAIKDFFNSVRDGLDRFDEIEEVKVQRIYRDIRFSKDKTPYKTHFSGGFRRAGKYRRGGFYVHLEPGNSLVGGGFYAPNKEDLLRYRKEVEVDAEPLLKIINKTAFKKHFGELQGEELKSAPRGFAKDHPHIDLIRKKSFYFFHRFTNKEVHDITFEKEVLKTFKLIMPYFDYMSEVLTTDLNGERI